MWLSVRPLFSLARFVPLIFPHNAKASIVVDRSRARSIPRFSLAQIGSRNPRGEIRRSCLAACRTSSPIRVFRSRTRAHSTLAEARPSYCSRNHRRQRAKLDTFFANFAQVPCAVGSTLFVGNLFYCAYDPRILPPLPREEAATCHPRFVRLGISVRLVKRAGQTCVLHVARICSAVEAATRARASIDGSVVRHEYVAGIRIIIETSRTER